MQEIDSHYDIRMDIDLSHLRQWIGSAETLEDFAGTAPLRALAAALDRDDPPLKAGDEVPPCWHWLYFLPTPRQSHIGLDGHPRRGGFLPPVPLARRMWAGSRLRWHQALRVGHSYTRTSRITAIDSKMGQSGPLVFVRVHHEISGEDGIAVVEDQDIVYRDHPRAGEAPPAPVAAPSTCDWSRDLQVEPTLLFRYSALTLNGHRIHYDRPYATGEEGYPGLVVHGPLLATLLLELLRVHRPEALVREFTFRLAKPTFDITPFTLCGAMVEAQKAVNLWVRHGDGALAMNAVATLA